MKMAWEESLELQTLEMSPGEARRVCLFSALVEGRCAI